MRPQACQEPTDDHTHPIAEAAPRHQETCASCASAARLDQTWEATRPAEPSAAALDAFWTRAAVELDRIEASRRSRAGDRVRAIPFRRRRIVAWIALAQAAVILIGAGIALARRGGEPARLPQLVDQPANVTSKSAEQPVDVGFDETLVIRIDDHKREVFLIPEPADAPSLADNSRHDMFNDMESNATP